MHMLDPEISILLVEDKKTVDGGDQREPSVSQPQQAARLFSDS